MKVMYGCLGCGKPIPLRGRCESCAKDGPQLHPAGHRSLWRDKHEQARFRKRLIAEFDGRCAYILDGVRCYKTIRDGFQLQAHHGKKGTPDLLLCRTHHRAVDPWAR